MPPPRGGREVPWTLSSSSSRRGGTDREIPEDHLILSYHPLMVSTLNRLGLKELIINRLATQGYPSVANDTTRTLVRGTRPVPTAVFRDTLRRCLVTDVTFTNYGMKIPLQQSTIFKKSSYLSSSRPSPGYPMNSYDISYTCKSSTLLTIRLRQELHQKHIESLKSLVNQYWWGHARHWSETAKIVPQVGHWLNYLVKLSILFIDPVRPDVGRCSCCSA